MEPSSPPKSGPEFFLLFQDDPKNSSLDVLQGTHKFLVETVDGKYDGPTNNALIEIFQKFTDTPIRKYVFTRMTKPLLLELAICILQDIIQNGPERTASLKLVISSTASGGKEVTIKENLKEKLGDDEFPIDPAFVADIDQAFFSLQDSSGSSPESAFKSGPTHGAAYSPPDASGYFTPLRRSASSEAIMGNIFSQVG